MHYRYYEQRVRLNFGQSQYLISDCSCLHARRARISSKTRVYLDIWSVRAFIGRGLRKKELPKRPTSHVQHNFVPVSILKRNFDVILNACTMRSAIAAQAERYDKLLIRQVTYRSVPTVWRTIPAPWLHNGINIQIERVLRLFLRNNLFCVIQQFCKFLIFLFLRQRTNGKILVVKFRSRNLLLLSKEITTCGFRNYDVTI